MLRYQRIEFKRDLVARPGDNIKLEVNAPVELLRLLKTRCVSENARLIR